MIRLFRGFLILSVLLVPALLAQDVSTLYIFKAAWYEQNAADDPVLFPQAEDPFDFTALAYLSDEVLSDPDWGLWISGITVRTPGGRTEGMNLDPASGSFEFYEGAVTAQVLNQRYGAGNYRFTLSSVITGNSTYDVPLAAEDYPPAPKVTNFDAAQKVDPPTITGWRVLENGDLELTANCTPNRSLTVQGAADLKAAFSTLQTTNPTASPAILILPRTSLGNRMFIRVYQE